MEEGRTSPAYEEYVPVNHQLSPTRSSTWANGATSSHSSPVSDERSEFTASYSDGETSPLYCHNSPSMTVPSRSRHAPSTVPESTQYSNGNHRTINGGSQSVADEVGLLPLFAAPPPLPPTTESMLDNIGTLFLYTEWHSTNLILKLPKPYFTIISVVILMHWSSKPPMPFLSCHLLSYAKVSIYLLLIMRCPI